MLIVPAVFVMRNGNGGTFFFKNGGLLTYSSVSQIFEICFGTRVRSLPDVLRIATPKKRLPGAGGGFLTSELSFCCVPAMLWLNTSPKQFIRPKRLIAIVALTAEVTTMSRGCQSVHSRVLIVEPGTDLASLEIRWSYSLSKDLVIPS